jgi:type IV secretion system protein VirD4
MKPLRLLIIIILPVILAIAALWLSGFYFLLLSKLDSSQANLFTIYDYWQSYGNLEYVSKHIAAAIIGALLTVALPVGLFFIPKPRSLYGDAKWANISDIRKSGLFDNDGLILGLTHTFFGTIPKFITLPGSQHVLLAAPTRSGKGVGIVVPNLLTYKDSVVVLDIKQENWDITAGFRAAHGQNCYLINLAPRDHLTHSWNPLTYISEDPAFRINDIQGIGQMLFPSNPHEAPIWQASSRSLWLGIILYLIESKELPVTLGESLRRVTMGDEILKENVEARQESENPLSDECYLALKEYLDTPEKTRGSVRKGFTSALEILYNPIVDLATSKNDFDLRDIRKKRMSIYVAVSPNDLERLSPLINLFFQQLIDLNTRELPEKNPDLKYQCLVLADEFTALGKIGVLSKGISYVAGYGLRIMPIIQSKSQLRSVYGADDAETFTDNHAMKIIFPPKEIKEAKEISEILGTTTVKNKSKSKSRATDLLGKANHSTNVSHHSRALLLPQEVTQLPDTTEILLYENTLPIKCEKIKWYDHPLLKERGNGRDGVIKWPSPSVPKLSLLDREKSSVQKPLKQETKNETITRSITPEDLKNLDSLNLDDFSCDFSNIEIPEGELSDSDMETLVNQFFDGISQSEEKVNE